MLSGAYTIKEDGRSPLPSWAFECELSKARPDLGCDLEGEVSASLSDGEEIYLCDWHWRALVDEGDISEEA